MRDFVIANEEEEEKKSSNPEKKKTNLLSAFILGSHLQNEIERLDRHTDSSFTQREHLKVVEGYLKEFYLW